MIANIKHTNIKAYTTTLSLSINSAYANIKTLKKRKLRPINFDLPSFNIPTPHLFNRQNPLYKS